MPAAVLLLALTGLDRDALKVLGGLAVALAIALAFAISSFMATLGAIAPGETVHRTEPKTIPAEQLVVMEDAAGLCGLPWQVLAAIADVESDFGRNMATSEAGAIGYGQFLPQTWAAYGGDGNPYDYRDAIPAMARYLCANGGPQDLRDAVYAYNHAGWYVRDVLTLAAKYGYLVPGGANSQVVEIARSQIGMPYVWGGASPETSFDCSGLVQWVYGRIGARLPRTAQQQFDATARVPIDQLQPGDLVFFAQTYASSDYITHVGIYTGNGRMVNAPSQGDVVRDMPVFGGYWLEHYAGGGRVVR